MLILRGDDEPYLLRISEHPGGYVVNAERNPRPSYLKLHRTTCPHISSPGRPGAYTERDYIKVCSHGRPALDRWARDDVGRRTRSHLRLPLKTPPLPLPASRWLKRCRKPRKRANNDNRSPGSAREPARGARIRKPRLSATCPIGCRSTPGVPAVQAPVLGIDPGRSRLASQHCRALGQVRGVDLGGIPVHQQRAWPAAALAVRPPGQFPRDRPQPQRAARVPARPAVRSTPSALPLRVPAVAADKAPSQDNTAVPGRLGRLRRRSPEEHGDPVSPHHGQESLSDTRTFTDP